MKLIDHSNGRLIGSAAHTIADARRVVDIADEAEDSGLDRAIRAIERRIKSPGTCAHPKKALSRKQMGINALMEELREEIRAMKHNDLPF